MMGHDADAWRMATAGPPSLRTRAALVARVERLANAFQYEELTQLLEPLWPAAMQVEPELAIAYALCLLNAEEHPRSLEVLTAAKPWVDATHDASLIRRHRNLLGLSHFWLCRYDAAEELYSEALASAERGGDMRVRSWTNMNLGACADVRTRWTEALGYYNRALAALQHSHVQARDFAQIYHMIGMTYRAMGRYVQADTYFNKAHVTLGEYLSPRERLIVQVEYALLHVLAGDAELGEAMADRVLRDARDTRYLREMHEAERVLGLVSEMTGDFVGAIHRLELARAGARATGYRLLEAEAGEDLARVARRSGARDNAERYLGEAVSVYNSIGLPERAEQARKRTEQ